LATQLKRRDRDTSLNMIVFGEYYLGRGDVYSVKRASTFWRTLLPVLIFNQEGNTVG
jgi:hypothetical protein